MALAHPTKFYEEVVQTLCKADAANVAVLASGSAHPSAWVALRRLRTVVFVSTERQHAHALAHAIRIGRRLRTQDLCPVITSGITSRANPYELIEGPDVSEDQQVFRIAHCVTMWLTSLWGLACEPLLLASRAFAALESICW